MFINLIVFSSTLHDGASVLGTRAKLFSDIRSFAGLNLVSSEEYFLNEENQNAPREENSLTVCFIATGGTEGIFMKYCQRLLSPIILMSDCYHNSFAASFEIATWLNQRSIPHELINIPSEYASLDFLAFKLSCLQIRHVLNGMSSYFQSLGKKESEDEDYELSMIYQREDVKEYLSNSVVGLIGGESEWLISSQIDKKYISDRFGTKFVEIDINELVSLYKSDLNNDIETPFDEAKLMFASIKKLCNKYSLTAITIKCFDLLNTCKTTACYALSQLNDEGIIAGCEGDIPTLWSMMMVKALTGKASFMANPSASSNSERSIDFAHCTVPLSMTKSYSLPSHFESDIGVAIEGDMDLGYYTILKIGGERLSKLYVGHGMVSQNTKIKQRCRTQIRFVFRSDEEYHKFLDNRLGNHIVLIQGGCI